MTLTIIIFIIYFLIILLIGYITGKKKKETADDYFLSGRKLPWYAIGLSMIAANVSSEHFIGVVGAAYLFGVAPGNWDLLAVIPLCLYIFFFLPYYFRSKIYTIPQFLEKRYNRTTRTIFASLTIVHSVIAILAGALYTGGLLFQDLFSSAGVAATASGEISTSLIWGILIIGISTGAYCIYGGLDSVVWTDVFQVIVLLTAGVLVTVVALDKAGGWDNVVAINNAASAERMHLVKPATNTLAPWTGIITLWLTLGVWYNCTNQFYIQQTLGAKSEWDARMGIVLTAFLKGVLAFMFVMPAMIAFALFGPGLQQDKVFIKLVHETLPPWVQSIVITGLVAAIMSTVSSVLNSVSTIFTIDIYQRYFKKDASQEQLIRTGRWVVTIVLILAMIWAPFVLLLGQGLFVYIQDLASFFAPPISVIFLAAIFWRRATAAAANSTLIFGFVFGIMLRFFGQGLSPYLVPFLNRALVGWIISFLIMVIVSLITKPKIEKMYDLDISWRPSYAKLPPEEIKKYKGWKNYLLWLGLVIIIRIVIYFIYA